MLNTSHIPVGHLYVFAEMSIQLFCSLFNQATFLGGGDYWVTGVAYMLIFWILTFIRYIDCKYFLPLHRSSFYFVDCFICCVEVFQFDVIPFCLLFSLVICAFGVISKKSLPWPFVKKLFSFSSRSFMVSTFIFKSLIHLKLIFV